MAVVVRPLRTDEAKTFLEIQRAAVRGLAAKDYSADIIDGWAPLPITEEMILEFLKNREHEIRLIAELDGRPAGIAALVVAKSELRACYVMPDAARNGVGTALVNEVERIARLKGLAHLNINSSLTAEPFYAVQGYETRGRFEHIQRSGQRMAAVEMRKLI